MTSPRTGTPTLPGDVGQPRDVRLPHPIELPSEVLDRKFEPGKGIDGTCWLPVVHEATGSPPVSLFATARHGVAVSASPAG